MSKGTKQVEDAPGASAKVVSDHVAACFAFEQLEKQMGTLRTWLEIDRGVERQLFAALSTAQLAQALVLRLQAMAIALAGEL